MLDYWCKRDHSVDSQTENLETNASWLTGIIIIIISCQEKEKKKLKVN